MTTAEQSSIDLNDRPRLGERLSATMRDPQVVPQGEHIIALEGAVRAVKQAHADVVELLLDMFAQSD